MPCFFKIKASNEQEINAILTQIINLNISLFDGKKNISRLGRTDMISIELPIPFRIVQSNILDSRLYYQNILIAQTPLNGATVLMEDLEKLQSVIRSSSIITKQPSLGRPVNSLHSLVFFNKLNGSDAVYLYNIQDENYNRLLKPGEHRYTAELHEKLKQEGKFVIVCTIPDGYYSKSETKEDSPLAGNFPSQGAVRCL